MTEIKNGHLYFGGADVCALAEKYGTPLYVFDENRIRENCRKFSEAIGKYFNGLPAYASKAFSCKGIYKIVASEGFGADVVSGGEIYTALSAGFSAEKLIFHGNNKTERELRYAIESDVGRIVADNEDELFTLNSIALEKGKKAKVILRVKPGVEAHTHNFIKTGQNDSKFGVAIDGGEAFSLIETTSKLKGINLAGIHCHIGSQILETEPYALAADKMISLIAEAKYKLGLMLGELIIGGGFGIRYTEEDEPLEPELYFREIKETVERRCAEYGIPEPFLITEPGRAIIADAGITLYKVGSVKTVPGIRTYVSVDGGMTDNPRYILYGSKYEFTVANKADKEKTFTATVAGRNCESGDLLGENVSIQTPVSGDILAVMCTGAYNYSMASNYNRVPRPAAVMLRDGEDRLFIKRETYSQLTENDLD